LPSTKSRDRQAFPGLGGGVLDSHLETPSIRRSTREMTQNDLVPYCELNNEQPMVMVSTRPIRIHPARTGRRAYRLTGLRRCYASGSAIGNRLQRRSGDGRHSQIHVHRRGSGGIDLCGDGFDGDLPQPGADLRAYEALLAEGERSSVFGNLLLERAKQTARQRAKLFAGGVSPALSARQFEALRTEILRLARRLRRRNPSRRPNPHER